MYTQDAMSGSGTSLIFLGLWLWMLFKIYKSSGVGTALKALLLIITGCLLLFFGFTALLFMAVNIHWIFCFGFLAFLLYCFLRKR